MKRNLLLLSLLLLAAGLFAQTVSVLPAVQLTQAGQTFVETIHLDTATQIRGVTVWIEYDPDRVSYVSHARGGIWDGFSSFWSRFAQETPSRIRISNTILGAGLSVTGPGDLLHITFNAIAGDYSRMDFFHIELYDIDGYVIPGTVTNDGQVIIGPAPAYAKLKCWLQGPYSEGAMLTGQNLLIPLTSPYPADPVTTDSIPTDVVDWVLMELRSSPTGQPVLSRSLWLGADGWLRSPEAPFVLLMNPPPGPYYTVIRHRNHLALMSAAAFAFSSSGNPFELDLSNSANIHGAAGAAEVEPGSFGLIAGDADQNGAVGPSDRNSHWRLQTGSSGYLSADFNLNGEVSPSDLNACWRLNTGLTTQVPPSR